MRIRALIPAVIAVIVLVGGPFGFGPMRDTDARGGLICYCCSSMEKNCAMISCAGCCGAHAGSVADRWSPEMILVSFPTITPLQIVHGGSEAVRSPETAYLEVPDKPPEKV
jgi:hypothetical protein